MEAFHGIFHQRSLGLGRMRSDCIVTRIRLARMQKLPRMEGGDGSEDGEQAAASSDNYLQWHFAPGAASTILRTPPIATSSQAACHITNWRYSSRKFGTVNVSR